MRQPKQHALPLELQQRALQEARHVVVQLLHLVRRGQRAQLAPAVGPWAGREGLRSWTEPAPLQQYTSSAACLPASTPVSSASPRSLPGGLERGLRDQALLADQAHPKLPAKLLLLGSEPLLLVQR